MTDSNKDDQLINAYIDNQLNDEDAHIFLQRCEKEPAFKARYERLKKVERKVVDSLQTIDNQPFSRGIEALLSQAGAEPSKERKSKRHWYAMAASAAAIAITVVMVMSRPFSADVFLQSDIQVALNDARSGQVYTINGDDVSRINVLFTFIDNEEKPCRLISIESETESIMRAVACYQDDHWQPHAVVQRSVAINPNGYTPASRFSDARIDSYLDLNLKDGPLSKASEEELLNGL